MSIAAGMHILFYDGYRYGFNGMERDDELNGIGAMYHYGFRIYDTRIAKFLSVDPLTKSYPMLTPYQYASNNPILFIDLDGLEGVHPTLFGKKDLAFMHTTEVVNFNLTSHTLYIQHTLANGNVVYITPFKTLQTKLWKTGYKIYSVDFFGGHLDETLTAGLLADHMDPASSPFTAISWSDVSAEERVNSVVGHFAKGVVTEPVKTKSLAESQAADMGSGYSKAFRHQIWMGMLSDIYGEEMAWLIGSTHEKGDGGYASIIKEESEMKTYGGERVQSMGDLVNNYWGIQHMNSFKVEYGAINNIDDFVNYLNYSAKILTEYEGFKDALGDVTIEFTKGTQGVQQLYDTYSNAKTNATN